MANLPVNQLNRGQAVQIDGSLYSIVSMDHVKPGKGPAYHQTKLKDIESGRIIEKRFRSGEVVDAVDVDRQNYTYSYRAGEELVFLHEKTYEQIEVRQEVLGDDALYLLEGQSVLIVVAQGRIIEVELPPAVELIVTEAEPGLKNATATSVYKGAVVETGLKVQVPPFINVGDKIKIDTETGKYMERVAIG